MAITHADVAREPLRNRARLLRWEGDSIREIAVTLGVPRSTVGGWVRGISIEASMVKYCGWCGDAFLACRRDKGYCNQVHRQAHRRAEGQAFLRTL